MSFDATRAVWAARRSGDLEGGPRLLVALAMADLTYQDTGEAVAGTRGLATVCGMSHSTVTAALRELEGGGVIERVQRGGGSRCSRWRWVLAPPPQRYPHGALEAVDNSDQRAKSVTLTVPESNAKPSQRAASVTPALLLRNDYQDQVYPRVSEADPPAHLRDGVDPDDVRERVTALREALGGHRGGQRTPSHNGARPPVPDLDDGWMP